MYFTHYSDKVKISIHALREESDCAVLFFSKADTEFLSTLSVRRATNGSGFTDMYLDISIHALREESDSFRASSTLLAYISIHALREESDWCNDIPTLIDLNFYPRSP